MADKTIKPIYYHLPILGDTRMRFYTFTKIRKDRAKFLRSLESADCTLNRLLDELEAYRRKRPEG